MPEERSCFPEPMLDKGARCVKCDMLLLPLLSYLCVSTPFEIYCSENINTSILKHFYILYTFESHRKWVPVRQPLNYCLWLRTKGICFKDTSGYQKEGQGWFFCGVFVSFEFWALERCLAIARWTPLAMLQLGKMRNAGANSTYRAGNREEWDYTPRERSALHIRNGSNARIYLEAEYLLFLLNGYEGVKALFHICLGI